ncbi:hypothetical protein PUV54_08100 [Hyphococcus flavus]|uniref:Uncharacterized protein n=1 Tax=Hyphococcus flavus TaxID=1866326 RepID=A0AAE9ZI86_9PROT|nr:hypothetical protein [Hyphococcus flavus]WDI33157.1 hypothetical protein PUV54_08100 [Hyphococcus flavus]
MSSLIHEEANKAKARTPCAAFSKFHISSVSLYASSVEKEFTAAAVKRGEESKENLGALGGNRWRFFSS